MTEYLGPAPYPEFDGTQPCVADPDLFFPHETDWRSAKSAKALCAECPFLRGCLAYALTHQVAGIWGGTDESERASLRRRHGIRAASLYGQRPMTTVPTSATGGDDDDLA